MRFTGLSNAMRLSGAILALCLAIRASAQDADTPAEPPAEPPTMAHASEAEQAVLKRLLDSDTWVRRAIVTLRLERYRDEASRALLERLLDDPAWQVRAYATRALARRGVAAGESWFSKEQNPRVIRTALRYRYPVARDRLARGMRHLQRSNSLEEKMLAVEIGAASSDEELIAGATDIAKTIILRMDRTVAGALSPRLAEVTGQNELRTFYRWQEWLRKSGRRFELLPGLAPAPETAPGAPSLLARLPSERFAALEDYMAQLRRRRLDLAIVLDCTSSMVGEIAEAQGGIDDMMLFVSDVVGDLRIAIVGYRDRRDEFVTKAWDFTANVEEARARLWTLTADGGGDTPEAVHEALKLAYQKLTWRYDSTKALVLVGDAPPHVGFGTKCVQLAKLGMDVAELTTHVIQADGRDVKHFPEIAEAGGGKSVTLEDDDSLIAEITGLTLGDAFDEEFREFFQVYLELCR